MCSLEDVIDTKLDVLTRIVRWGGSGLALWIGADSFSAMRETHNHARGSNHGPGSSGVQSL